MKLRHIAITFIALLTLALLAFAWPATNIVVFGQTIDWNGLNLATITNDRVEGELEFKDGLDLRGGQRYVFSTDMTTIEEIKDEQTGEINNQKQHEFADNQVEILADRITRYGYEEFRIYWWIEESTNSLKVELTISEGNQYDDIIIPLLFSKGELSFWTQDPQDLENQIQQEIPETAEELPAQEQSTPVPAEFSSQDLLAIKSIYSQNTPRINEAGETIHGYGLKLIFKEDGFFKVQLATLSESEITTQLRIDGQPLAIRYLPVDTEGNAMYMNSLFEDSFAVNDAIVVLYQTGQLAQEFNQDSSQSVEPFLSSNYEWEIKLAFAISFALLSILLIVRYKYLGIYIVVTMLVTTIWTLFLLKFTGVRLSLPLAVGVVISLVLNLLLQLDLVKRLKNYKKLNLKKIRSQLSIYRPAYRNLLITFLGLAAFLGMLGLYEVESMMLGFGVGVILLLVLLYINLSVFLPDFYLLQEKYFDEKDKK